MIAGLAVYRMFGQQVVEGLGDVVGFATRDIIDSVLYLILILGMPILLYFKSGRGGLGGILRLAEAAAFMILLVILTFSQLGQFFYIDQLSKDIG